MSQFDYGVIDPATKSGTILAQDLNSGRDAWVTQHKGATVPTYATSGAAGMMWLDDSNDPNWAFKVWDGTNSTTIYTLNTSTQLIDFGTLNQLNVVEGAGNAATAHVDADTGIFKGVGHTGVSVLSPNDKEANLYLGSVALNNRGQVKINNSSNLMSLMTNVAGGAISILTGAGTLAMKVMSDQRIGIGTGSPNALSKLHVQIATTGTTFDVASDDVIFEGNGAFGIGIITNNAGIAKLSLGAPDTPVGFMASWDEPNNIGTLGTLNVSADLRINYGNGVVGIFLDGGDNRMGVFNSAPENMFHLGGAMWFDGTGTVDVDLRGDLVGNQSVQISPVGSTHTRVYIEGSTAGGLNLVATDAPTDRKLFSIDNNAGHLNFIGHVDDLSTNFLYLRMSYTNSLFETKIWGDFYINDLKPGSGTLNLKIDSTGKIIAV